MASFFVSRVDTASTSAWRRSATRPYGKAAWPTPGTPTGRFEEIFSGPRWEALRHAGAHVQRPLWASTGTKNPRYSDTMYVDELVGPHTVNTMPLATLQAVADHGHISGSDRQHDPDDDLKALADAGIDLARSPTSCWWTASSSSRTP